MLQPGSPWCRAPPRGRRKWRPPPHFSAAQGRSPVPLAPSGDGGSRPAAPLPAMAAAVPGYSPGFKKPPATLRLKRKRPRRSEPAASQPCGAAPRAPSTSVRRNPFSSLDNAPRQPVWRQQEPAQPGRGPASTVPFWQVEIRSEGKGFVRFLCKKPVLTLSISRFFPSVFRVCRRRQAGPERGALRGNRRPGAARGTGPHVTILKRLLLH